MKTRSREKVATYISGVNIFFRGGGGVIITTITTVMYATYVE